MSVFVSVGTTLFEDLITTIQNKEIINELYNLGFSKLIIQYGKGTKPCFNNNELLTTECFDYKPSILPYFKNASLVISHGGSGSILETLREGKKLIVVINRSLMHDHQTELAEQLAKDNYLIYTDCDGLLETLQGKKWNNLSKFPDAPDINPFITELDKYIGFS